MFPRRRSTTPVGAGPLDIPYDQSGGNMSTGGMQVPEPGGTMKKMSFEFTDPAQAAAQQSPQIPAGVGVPPAGASQPAQMPAGAQAPAQQMPGNIFGAMAGGADTFGQGPDSSMFTDDQLASMVQEEPLDPINLEADSLEQQLMSGDPNIQMQMMQAARRMGGF